MEEKKNCRTYRGDVKTLPIGQLLKRIRPGLIATGIVTWPRSGNHCSYGWEQTMAMLSSG